MYYIDIAFKNIIAHRRRSAITIMAVMLGFAALSLVSGVINNIFVFLEDQAVQMERLGHLTVAKEGFFTEGKLDPAKYHIEADELPEVVEILKADPHVRLVTPRLNLRGVITDGDVSTIFLAEGIVPEDDAVLTQGFTQVEGEDASSGRLDPDNKMGVALSEELSELLGVDKGGDVILFTSTLDGQANAMDASVIDVYNTGNPATNDKFVMLPMGFAQELYDTQGAERLVVLLDDAEETDAARDRLTDALASAGYSVEVRTWYEQSLFYEKVRTMFGMVFRVVSMIVFVVVVMTVLNTMMAAVAERTREIGTLRSLGMHRATVARLFAAEGFIIAAIGCLLGVPLTLLGMAAVNSAGISFVPPVSSSPAPVMVVLYPPLMVGVTVVFLVLGSIAAFIPARSAARREIVDALGHI